MPHPFSRFQALAARATGAGVAVLFVSASQVEETRRFAQAMPGLRPLLVAHRSQNALLHDFAVEGMPCYCLVDQAGRVRASGISLGVLEEELDRLLRECARARNEP